MNRKELKEFLDDKVHHYEHPKFLDSDPLQIPHRFSKKEDIEISAFLTATIAWGNRKSIINNATRLMELMDSSPYDFVANHRSSDLERLSGFVHRTFNGRDASYFIQSLQNLYENHGGLEMAFSKHEKSIPINSDGTEIPATFDKCNSANPSQGTTTPRKTSETNHSTKFRGRPDSLQSSISAFKRTFFELLPPLRPDPKTCKRPPERLRCQTYQYVLALDGTTGGQGSGLRPLERYWNRAAIVPVGRTLRQGGPQAQTVETEAKRCQGPGGIGPKPAQARPH